MSETSCIWCESAKGEVASAGVSKGFSVDGERLCDGEESGMGGEKEFLAVRNQWNLGN